MLTILKLVKNPKQNSSSHFVRHEKTSNLSYIVRQDLPLVLSVGVFFYT